MDCAVLAREAIRSGQSIQGPAVIESMDSTILVPPGWTATADAKGYIIMEAKGDG